MSSLRGWRPLLRLARRDVRRNKGRSAVAVAMIMLPVLFVTAIATLWATAEVSATESLERRLGPDATALIEIAPEGGSVEQGVDPADGWVTEGSGETTTTADIVDVLGPGTTLVPVRRGWSLLSPDGERESVAWLETDFATDLGAGLVRLRDGALPQGDDEVLMTPDVAEALGLSIGDTLSTDLGERTLVGLYDDPDLTGGAVAGNVGAWAAPDATPVDPLAQNADADAETATISVDSLGFLVGGTPVSWEQVRALNARGAWVLSREVVEDPPAAATEFTAEFGPGEAQASLALALIVVMVLLEVVLLAGPAFAVGARSQARALALLAASGGTPGQLRLLVLGAGLVLGSIAAVVGTLSGLVAAALAWPVQAWLVRHADVPWLATATRPGPYEVPWVMVVALAVFAIVAALLAAAVPAWLAARADVVATLAGRRGDPSPGRRSPLAGLALVLLAAGLAALGMADQSGLWAAAASVPLTIGMVLLIGPLLGVLARAADRLPLTLRYVVRDAARQRSRTVPAVAAIAATVMGAVALGVGASSDWTSQERDYQPVLPLDAAVVDTPGPGEVDGGDPFIMDGLRAAVQNVDPGAPIADIDSLVPTAALLAEHPDETVSDWWVSEDREQVLPVNGSSGGFGSPLVVADDLESGAGPSLAEGIQPEDRTIAARALASGEAVVLVADAAEVGERVEVTMSRDWYEASDASATSTTIPVSAIGVRPAGASGSDISRSTYFSVLLPSAVADELAAGGDLEIAPISLLLPEGLTPAQEERLDAALLELDPTQGTWVIVERGYTPPTSVIYFLLGLGGAAIALVLAGSLTATRLALTDAEGDLATLGAVGAGPGLRRRIAAAYALLLAVVGGGLGLLAGLGLGVPAAVSLTDMSRWDPTLPGPVVDVPWLLVLALVVLLPLITAGVAAATTRSRLPLGRRPA